MDWQRLWYYTLGAAALLILAGVGLRDPWPADEPRFALIARDMVETGQWFFPFRGGEIYPDKPPVMMWLMAIFYAITGHLKVSFLLPSALLSIGTVVLTYLCGKMLWDRRTGVIAVWLLLATAQFMLKSKSAQLDAGVTFFITLACYGLLRHLIIGPHWRWYALAWFSMGLGVITKGVGFLPALMLLNLIWLRPDWLKQQASVQWLRWLSGPLFMLLAIGLWLLPMLWLVAHSGDADLIAYRDNILLRQTVERYANAWGHIQPFWYYLLEALPFWWMPTSWLALWCVPHWRRAFQTRDARVVYPLVWIALVLLFFSLSSGKRAVYLLPATPMLALTLAPYASQLLQRRGLNGLLLVSLGLLGALLLSAGIAGLAGVTKLAELTEKYGVNPWTWFTALGLVAALTLWLNRRVAWRAWAWFFPALWLSFSFWGYPLLDRARSTEPMMAALQKVLPADATLALVDFREKLLLHTPWPTWHFGYHTPNEWQWPAAAQWLNAGSKRYVLVNSDAMDTPCFNAQDQIDYHPVHQREWLLFERAEDCGAPDPQRPVRMYSRKAGSGHH